MKNLLDCAMDIGEQMLVCGGEVHRVEDSVKRICYAFGAKRVDVFTITSSMVVTIHTQNGDIFTQTRRINDTGNNFERLHRLNGLSRKICQSKMSAKDIRKEFNRILSSKTYPLWLEFICYSVISGLFTFSFGGNIIEALIALLVGASIRMIILICDKTIKNKIFAKFISSFTATAVAHAAFAFSIIPTVDNIIIGTIMTLVPGLGLTNALRDLFVGDSIAGILRTIEACITAIAIAAGYFIFIFII